MFRLYRRIRQQLVSQKKFSSYLFYAIGEIALVVIGVLIAVQINNWNENRKTAILAAELLTEIQNNIIVNIDLIKSHTSVIDRLNATSEKVVSIIEQRAKYNQDFESDFYFCFFSGTNIYVSNDGYEALKNAGFEIIKNNILKKEIVELFGVKNLKNAHFIEYIKENFKVYESFLIQNFLTEDQRLIPIDYQALIENQQFLAIVKRIKERRTSILKTLNIAIEENEEVLQLIQGELGV
jgi:hypothetical protein